MRAGLLKLKPSGSCCLLHLRPGVLFIGTRRTKGPRGFASRSAMAAATGRGALVWYRRDLRTSDHEALLASADATSVVPFYALDAAQLRFQEEDGGPAALRLPVLGPHRCRFLLESLAALHQSLKNLGSGLDFSISSAPDAITRLVALLARECSSITLCYHLDYGLSHQEEAAAAERAFLQAAKAAGLEASIRCFWDRTLVHPEDLPVPWADNAAASSPPLNSGALFFPFVTARLAGAPTVMTEFRKAVEAECLPRPPLPAPAALPPVPTAVLEASAPLPASAAELYATAGATGALEELGRLAGCSVNSAEHASSVFRVGGGEASAAARLRHMLHGESTDADSSRPVVGYGASRMLATGADNSAKLSASLAHGCLTARQVWAALAEPPAGTEDGCQWLRMHLHIRDFFNLMLLKPRPAAPNAWAAEQPAELEGMEPADVFGRWCRGQTGLPFVDASMRELAATGYMSNRSRQNVASLLAKAPAGTTIGERHFRILSGLPGKGKNADGCGVDWRWGEAWFRCLLLDYDPAANYGNWEYVAGAGLDPRGGARLFRTASQGMRYDPPAALIRRWLPPLAALPPEQAHQPWQAPGGSVEGYPPPLLAPDSQLTRQDRQRAE